MNVTDFQEIWQIDIGDQVYEATFEVLTQWIGEGSLLPQDKVRRGNLRWIEARRVPALVPFFNAKESGAPPPVTTSTVSGETNGLPATVQTTNFPVTPHRAEPVPNTADPYRTNIVEAIPARSAPPTNAFVSPATSGFSVDRIEPQTSPFNQSPAAAEPFASPVFSDLPQACSMHPESQAFFVCETCANVFCKLCPKSYGGTVRICPFCGAMCQRIEQARSKGEQAAMYRAAVDGGFGFGDFASALAYPFKFKASLFFGAVLFMIFTIGQGASSFGGFFLMAASLMCYMLSNMLYFGILTNVLENFSQGFTTRNFMPSWDDFSLWDDVVHPFFLSVAVYLVSFGLFIVIGVGSAVYAVKSVSNLNNKETAAQQNPFANDSEIKKFNEAFGDGDMNSSENEEERFRKMDEFIREQRKKQLESGIGKTPETLEKERNEMVSGFLKMALPLLLLMGAALLWGFFYLPAACLVAGYTRSFVATLNPKIGLETIRILGVDYVKILFMGLIVAIASGVVGFVLALIFLPFNLPSVGNLPAKAIAALASFYFSVVFSVVLGFALYKNSEKLNLFRS